MHYGVHSALAARLFFLPTSVFIVKVGAGKRLIKLFVKSAREKFYAKH